MCLRDGGMDLQSQGVQLRSVRAAHNRTDSATTDNGRRAARPCSPLRPFHSPHLSQHASHSPWPQSGKHTNGSVSSSLLKHTLQLAWLACLAATASSLMKRTPASLQALSRSSYQRIVNTGTFHLNVRSSCRTTGGHTAHAAEFAPRCVQTICTVRPSTAAHRCEACAPAMSVY